MDTNPNYEHPVLGVITDDEVQHVLWDREAAARWKAEDDELKEKLNKIIEELETIPSEDEYIAKRKRSVVVQLEKFRDEEL